MTPKKKAITGVLGTILLFSLVGVLVSRNHAINIANEAMQPLRVYGWHINSVRFFPAWNGPFWIITYQHDDYYACFPYQVAVDLTGKTSYKPTAQQLEDVIRAIKKERAKFEQCDTPDAAGQK
jgi:hypothetical protein